MSRTAFVVSLLTILQVILSTDYQVAARECRRTSSVLDSIRNLDRNTNQGGHVWQHIAGLTSTPSRASSDDTQLNKSLFRNWGAFTEAWGSWVNTRRNVYPVNCGNQRSTIADCVNTGRPIREGGFTCTAVQRNNRCTNSRPLTIRSYIFVYKNVRGRWIMRTAYPRSSWC